MRQQTGHGGDRSCPGVCARRRLKRAPTYVPEHEPEQARDVPQALGHRGGAGVAQLVVAAAQDRIAAKGSTWLYHTDAVGGEEARKEFCGGLGTESALGLCHSMQQARRQRPGLGGRGPDSIEKRASHSTSGARGSDGQYLLRVGLQL